MKVTTIIVCSAKGGVGKSTVAANIAHSLQKRVSEKSRAGSVHPCGVLLVDLDLTNRALDLLLGCEDSVVFDIGDLIDGRAHATDVLKISGGVSFAAAPAPTRNLSDAARFTDDPEKLRAAVSSLIYETKLSLEMIKANAGGTNTANNNSTQTNTVNADNDAYDDETLFVIIDTSATEVPCILAPMADYALIPSGQSPASVRAAERTGILTEKSGAKQSVLIINDFDMENAKNGVRARIIELIDRCRMKLYGVVPHDGTLVTRQDKGQFETAKRTKSPSSQAFDNIAARLCGENVPVFYGIKQYKSRGKYM